MANIAIFRINYKSDFILTLNSDAGWVTPFCIKFWTDAPSQAYFVGFDGTTYTHCAPVAGEPTKLLVQFDDHHLPIGDLKFQIGYHFTVADFPTSVEDEVINQASVIIEVDGAPAKVMLDFNGETAPEIEFSLPAYANEAQRIENEQQRIENEQQRIDNEQQRIDNEQTRQRNEETRIENEQQRVLEFGQMKGDLEQATRDAAAAAENANEKAVYAKNQGDYAKQQGDYAKQQGDTAKADHERAEEDHRIAGEDHTQAGSDHTRAGEDHTQAGSDHTRAGEDHTRAGEDHTRAESDHTRAESDHAAVEVYVDSLGAFDISAYHATGGVLAKYADLTAAIGTNGANIPEALRKGGMSVKFVQSSDNNYIQARLMANSFTTDVTKWQTVDKKPVSGSKNLVESGGVDADLYNLEKEVFNTTTQELVSASNIMVGYALKSDGQALNTGVQQQYLTNFINIENIDILNIKMCFPQNTDYAGIAFYSSNTEASFICSSRLSDGELPITWLYYEGTIQIPSGAKYIRVQGFSGSSYPSAVAIKVSSTSKINEINNTQLRFTFNGACSIVGNKCIIAQIPILVTQQIDGSKKGYFIQQGIYELSDNFTYLVAETSGKSSGETISPQTVSAGNITKSTFIIAAKNNGKVVCYTPMDNNNIDGKQLGVIDPTSAQSFTRKAVLGVDGVMQVISGGNDNWKVSDYIYIDDALEISFVFRAFSPTNNTYAGICFYSSNNEESFISYDNSYDGTDSESGWKYGISPVTIPSGAKYMRVAGFDMILPGSPYIGINKLTVKDRTLDFFLGNSRKILYVGDSITDTHYIPYAYPFIIEKITEAENINYAVASSGYAGDATGNHKIWGQQDTKVFNMIERAYEAEEMPNIIIMAAGTNDWDFSRPYGSIEDISQETMDNPTFYWYVAKAIKTAINRFYYSTFLVITPLPRLQNGRNQHTQNSVGKTLVDYSNAIKEVCDYYSIPYLDMTVESNMHLENQVAVNLYTANYLDNDEPDGLHPSKYYYYHFYAQKVLEKLRGLVR